MTDYRIFETDQFGKDLKSLAKAGRSRIAAKLRAVVYPELREHPHVGRNIKKLRDYKPELGDIVSGHGGFSTRTMTRDGSFL